LRQKDVSVIWFFRGENTGIKKSLSDFNNLKEIINWVKGLEK
jgi:hypothetical protein